MSGAEIVPCACVLGAVVFGAAVLFR